MDTNKLNKTDSPIKVRTYTDTSANDTGVDRIHKISVTSTSTGTNGTGANSTNSKMTAKDWLIVLAVIGGIWAFFAINHKSYEEYDLNGLTVAEACEKARGAGWEVDSVRHADYWDNHEKTDCYNTNQTVTNYEYYKNSKKVDIKYGTKKTEEEKEAEEADNHQSQLT